MWGGAEDTHPILVESVGSEPLVPVDQSLEYNSIIGRRYMVLLFCWYHKMVLDPANSVSLRALLIFEMEYEVSLNLGNVREDVIFLEVDLEGISLISYEGVCYPPDVP